MKAHRGTRGVHTPRSAEGKKNGRCPYLLNLTIDIVGMKIVDFKKKSFFDLIDIF